MQKGTPHSYRLFTVPITMGIIDIQEAIQGDVEDKVNDCVGARGFVLDARSRVSSKSFSSDFHLVSLMCPSG
jgi:hypothetical protein